jgi:hypothetical protein
MSPRKLCTGVLPRRLQAALAACTMHGTKTGGEAMADDLTPVERRRIESSRRIEETPAEHIAYQHTVTCPICSVQAQR